MTDQFMNGEETKEKLIVLPLEDELDIKPHDLLDSNLLAQCSPKEIIIQQRKLKKFSKFNRVTPDSMLEDTETKVDKSSLKYYEMKYKKLVPPEMIEPGIETEIPEMIISESDSDLPAESSQLVDVWSKIVIDLLKEIPQNSKETYENKILGLGDASPTKETAFILKRYWMELKRIKDKLHFRK